MEMKFCRRCGLPLQKDGEAYTCVNQHVLFSNPAPTVGVFFIEQETKKVVLSRRGIEPRKGELDSFGGFVEEGESFEAAAHREIEEETGLLPHEYSELKYLCSAVGLYPYDGEERSVLTVMFTATLKPSKTLEARDDVGEIVTLDIAALDETTVTAQDIREGVAHLRAYMRGKT